MFKNMYNTARGILTTRATNKWQGFIKLLTAILAAIAIISGVQLVLIVIPFLYKIVVHTAVTAICFYGMHLLHVGFIAGKSKES